MKEYVTKAQKAKRKNNATKRNLRRYNSSK